MPLRVLPMLYAARLEVVADAERLTAAVLEVLPVCSPAIQQQLLGFLPEVVLPQDHEVRQEGRGRTRAGSTVDLWLLHAAAECVD